MRLPRESAVAMDDLANSPGAEFHTGSPRLSLVVTTKGRHEVVRRLLDSLEAQDYKDMELIIVDQNNDEFLKPLLAGGRWSFPIRHLRAPCKRGASVGRNIGWPFARGDILLFPDDDCWYPPDFLSKGLRLLDAYDADIITGRASDYAGRDVNGRYRSRPGPITKGNVWTSQMEWITFIRRASIEKLGGYDEALGVGAPTPWQAAEGPDLILRALEERMRCHYFPDLIGYHEAFDTWLPSEDMIEKAAAYGRGMGYALRKHHYPLVSIIYWVCRSFINTAVSFGSGYWRRARLYRGVAMGRLEGWKGAGSRQ